MIKKYFYLFTFIFSVGVLSGCTTNPATGDRQFTAFMSPQQENQIGAQEHVKILAQYGLYDDKSLQGYVERVGQTVIKRGERPEVQYKFFVLDSPIVNAFALPGGYIYVTRGLLALANSEAEMASVLGHEAGHITGRHSAERYSRGVVTTLGAVILSAAIGNDAASQALGVGTDLYLSSYSRDQERQADSLGIRYLTQSGYDPYGMSSFLNNMRAQKDLQAHIDGKSSNDMSYFSTHPPTGERVHKTAVEANAVGVRGVWNRSDYLRMIDGMVFGDSAEQGFVRDTVFYHPKLGFKFSVPQTFKITNNPSHVVASSDHGVMMVFDFGENNARYDPQTYLRDVWVGNMGAQVQINGLEEISINGMRAATGYVEGSIGGKDMQIRLIAIAFGDTQIARFQIGLPAGLTGAQMDAVKSASYSFARLDGAERKMLRPYRLKVITAKAGDTVASLSARMIQSDRKEQRFRVLNGLHNGQGVDAGQMYKIVVE